MKMSWWRSSTIGPWPARLIHGLGSVAPWVWIVAVVALALGAYYALVVEPLEGRVEQLRREAAALGRHGAQQESASDPASRLAAFYAEFPRVDDIPDRMQAIFDAAQAEGLGATQGTYRLERNSEDRFTRYAIDLPVKGTYAQLRRFLAKVVAALPTLAVNEVQFSRTQAGDALVECRLAMTLYLMDRPPAP